MLKMKFFLDENIPLSAGALEEFLRNIKIENLINSITVLEVGRYRIRKLK